MDQHPAPPSPPYHAAGSYEEAASLLHSGAVALAGGTDLVPLMQEGLTAPALLVDLLRVERGASVTLSARGARIGAVARLSTLAEHRGLARAYPAFCQACREVGTLQLRNMATIGGNLCQRPRCWYFRSGIPCRKTGMAACPAEHGLNEMLAVLGGGPCWAVHPSDPAVALLALDARLGIRRADGSRREIPVGELYVSPARDPSRETDLAAGEVIEYLAIPPRYRRARQAYIKVTQRQAWDFALVSAAVAWPKSGGVPRLALGGVAPLPWLVDLRRLPAAPAARASNALELWAIRAADYALRGARPLSQNAYKVRMAKGVIRRALVATRSRSRAAHAQR